MKKLETVQSQDNGSKGLEEIEVAVENARMASEPLRKISSR
jgi:hypothetical protein